MNDAGECDLNCYVENCETCVEGETSVCGECVTNFHLDNPANASCDCLSSDNRQLVDDACVPMEGFYEDGAIEAAPCVAPCATCTSASICQSCISDSEYYLDDSNSCIECSTVTDDCMTC